jgi:hypothetical protein
VEQARGHVERGELRAAVNRLEEAYARSPLPNIAFNMALIYERLGTRRAVNDARRGVEVCERYLASKPAPQDRATMEGIRDKLRAALPPATKSTLEKEPPPAQTLTARRKMRPAPGPVMEANPHPVPASAAALAATVAPQPPLAAALGEGPSPPPLQPSKAPVEDPDAAFERGKRAGLQQAAQAGVQRQYNLKVGSGLIGAAVPLFAVAALLFYETGAANGELKSIDPGSQRPRFDELSDHKGLCLGFGVALMGAGVTALAFGLLYLAPPLRLRNNLVVLPTAGGVQMGGTF